MARRAAPHRGTDIHYGDLSGKDDDAAAQSRPSKTQLKQQSQALQTLGLALSELSAERFATIDMPEALRSAIAEFRHTKSHEGRRRQLQYVGKLMRSADEAALREAVAAATLGSARETLALHEAERWRAELIAGDDALTRWQQAHPETDTQQLRSLVRAARRDAAALPPEARQPKSFRELFQFIKPMLSHERTSAPA
ncbi:MAG: ribosome biogenesis factor YjgA [Rubrivivax sp.]|nr:ribosome biogenesis factor YjgA [Rubrivivax sp.]